MMYFLLRWYLNGMIRQGSLTVVGVDGTLHKFGDDTGTKVRVRLTDPSLYWKLAIYPDRFTD